MNTKTYKVMLKFLQPMLGTVPLNKELYQDYVISKRPEDVDNGDPDEETATVQETLEKGTTGFHRLSDGTPAIYNYMIKGLLKSACKTLRKDSESLSSKVTAYKTVIDGMVFVRPRLIAIHTAGPVSINERPLRADTPQGPRVALARSEQVCEGSTLTFWLQVLRGGPKRDLLEEWLDYAQFQGLGQWRSADWGSCELVELKEVESIGMG